MASRLLNMQDKTSESLPEIFQPRFQKDYFYFGGTGV
jgi:hypothetical protein